jgi:ribonuclease HI
VDQRRPWAFFDGASQKRNQSSGGAGGVLYLPDHVCFKMKMGFGSRSINYAKLKSLKLLLHFAKEKNINSIHFFGDSQLVVN